MAKVNDINNYAYVKEDWCMPTIEEPDGWNEVIVETAGFVPLEVRFKQMELAGYRAQFQASDFTSSDLRDIYLAPDLSYSEDDELEDIMEKERMRSALIEQIRQRNTQQTQQTDKEDLTKQASSDDNIDASSTDKQ